MAANEHGLTGGSSSAKRQANPPPKQPPKQPPRHHPRHPHKHPHKQPSEQRWFAWWIEWGARLGLLWLLVSFALYVSGALPSAIPLARLTELWSLPLADYLQRSGAPTGWAWLQHIGQGEGATLAGVAVLAGCAVPALLALMPLFRRRRDLPYLALCLAQVAVLLLAASGWISSGH